MNHYRISVRTFKWTTNVYNKKIENVPVASVTSEAAMEAKPMTEKQAKKKFNGAAKTFKTKQKMTIEAIDKFTTKPSWKSLDNLKSLDSLY